MRTWIFLSLQNLELTRQNDLQPFANNSRRCIKCSRCLFLSVSGILITLYSSVIFFGVSRARRICTLSEYDTFTRPSSRGNIPLSSKSFRTSLPFGYDIARSYFLLSIGYSTINRQSLPKTAFKSIVATILLSPLYLNFMFLVDLL